MLKFDIVDVFSSIVGEGNPVAIVHDAGLLDAGQMQKLATWIGLPETVFLMGPTSPGPDYSLRIFAPSCELAFAGHPSIGALAAQLSRNFEWQDRKEFIQECKAGLVELIVDRCNGEPVISVQTPVPADHSVISDEDVFGLLNALALKRCPTVCDKVSAGANWVIMRFDDEKDILDANPDQQSILELSMYHDVSGVTIFAPTTQSGADYIVRSFAPRIGVAEDAACGGGNACVAAVVSRLSGGNIRYLATQGQKLGRNAKIFSAGPFADHRFRIGGHTRLVVSGELNLP